MAVYPNPPPLFAELHARAVVKEAHTFRLRGIPMPPEQAAASDWFLARMDAEALKMAREQLEREERAAMDYLGIVRLADLLGRAAVTPDAVAAAFDDHYCNRGWWPTAALATLEQIGDLRDGMRGGLAEVAAPPPDLPDGIPGHRFVAMFYGVPLFVPEAA